MSHLQFKHELRAPIPTSRLQRSKAPRPQKRFLSMLEAHHLQNRSLAMLEEDDRLGNTCRKGAAANINGVHIRKRSLELNTMDGSVWAGVERKLQEQERKMAPSLNRWLAEGLVGCWLDGLASWLAGLWLSVLVG